MFTTCMPTVSVGKFGTFGTFRAINRFSYGKRWIIFCASWLPIDEENINSCSNMFSFINRYTGRRLWWERVNDETGSLTHGDIV